MKKKDEKTKERGLNKKRRCIKRKKNEEKEEMKDPE